MSDFVAAKIIKKINDLNYKIEISTQIIQDNELAYRVDTYKYYSQTDSKIYKRAYIGKEGECLECLLMRVLQSVVVE